MFAISISLEKDLGRMLKADGLIAALALGTLALGTLPSVAVTRIVFTITTKAGFGFLAWRYQLSINERTYMIKKLRLVFGANKRKQHNPKCE